MIEIDPGLDVANRRFQGFVAFRSYVADLRGWLRAHHPDVMTTDVLKALGFDILTFQAAAESAG
ncbi:hypothetical protein [Pseudonocardia oroxyli]|uniref:Uncharacterized protein n=1 Tax=Pseudonocardia oroxyli TaxID=366584 RepID=A0A1G7UN98_PSEOR|nr:hypothetical protein [Pseudonocardia oroxyli]SDG48210.1 hypothetical protein SAMN05216377_11279 [Pseudonocardia oroxyli]